ncbi:DMT family transporter [Marinobacter zhejiangensis]|uniref:Threonine/homoserine efflux transporter RhtA n=1 Tax=Marinobacter zhejiangensis TaxID=488535 RepID=A0A1I4Q693_9GAMM|nr:DMT family transporter [Marinobacter zhejiangensis]SFM35618.1 Threonine/homoserine efflux transporter RhtA [Marinobacter zhejiangensis]
MALRLAYLGLILTPLFWAGNAVVARAVAGEMPPLSMSFYRWLLALILVAPIGLPAVWRQREIVRQHWLIISVLAAFSVGAFNSLLYFAALTTTATNIALINTTIPVMVALLAWLLLGERTRPLQAMGITLAIVGIVTVVARGRWQTLMQLDWHPGDLIMVLAVFCWGLFSVLLRRHAVPLTALAFLTVQIAFGLVAILPFYLVDLVFFSGGFTVTSTNLLALGFFAVFPGILAYGFWNHAVHEVGPAKSALFMYLVPIFAAVMATLFLDERLAWFHVVGGVLILFGLLLATRSGQRR